MKHWVAANTNTSSHGLMICGQCHKPISAGDYAYRETDTAFITIHRSCIPHFKIWVELDSCRDEGLRELTKKLDSFVAFRGKWNTTALDEEIENMQRTIEAIKAAKGEV